MTGELLHDLEAALVELPTDLREIANRNIKKLRQSIDITQAELALLLEDETAAAQLRSTAAWLVGVLKVSSLTGVLSRVVPATRNQVVLWEAVKALCALETGSGMFRSMLVDGPSNEHRKAAAYALGCIRDASSTSILERVLSAHVESPELRAQAAEALGYVGDRYAVSTLLTTARDPSVEVRFWSVFALGSLGDRRALPVLQEIAKGDHAILEGWWSVSQEATAALGEIDHAGESSLQ